MIHTRFKRELGNLESSINYTKNFRLEKHHKILDIGCNYGSLLYHFYLENFSYLYGIDVAQDRIRQGQKTYPEIAQKLQFYEGKKLPFEDNFFDFIFMFDVIEHIPDIDTFLKEEVLRVLKPNGKMIFQTPNKWINIPWEIIHCKSFTAYKRFHCSLQTYSSLYTLLKEAGFTKINLEKFKISTLSNKTLVRKYFWYFGDLLLFILEKLPIRISSNFWGNCQK